MKVIPAETRPFPVPAGVRHAGDEEGWYLYAEGYSGEWIPQLTSTGTQPNLGSTGIAEGLYSLINGFFHGTFYMEFGSGGGATAGTGNYQIEGFPFQIDLRSRLRLPCGQVTLFDSDVSAVRIRDAAATSATALLMRDQGGVAVSATVPWTWAGGDYFHGNISFPALLE